MQNHRSGSAGEGLQNATLCDSSFTFQGDRKYNFYEKDSPEESYSKTIQKNKPEYSEGILRKNTNHESLGTSTQVGEERGHFAMGMFNNGPLSNDTEVKSARSDWKKSSTLHIS